MATFSLDLDAAHSRLNAGSRQILRDFLAGFREAVLKTELDVVRSHWRVFLDHGRNVILRRVKLGLLREAFEPGDEELAISCVEHAYQAMADAFDRIASYEFMSAEGFLATLKLHAVLALIDRLDVYGPWDLGQPIASPPIRFAPTGRRPRKKAPTPQ